MKREITAFIAPAPLAVALIAAGCGGSASDARDSSRPYGPAVMARGLHGAGAARVGVANSLLGRIVVGSDGRTLYVFEKDKYRRSACSGQCAKYWPPLLTHVKPVAGAGVKQSLLGITRRASGGDQVTYAGHPLYRFAGHRNPGQTKGEGLQAFGAGWDVFSPAGRKIESDG